MMRLLCFVVGLCLLVALYSITLPAHPTWYEGVSLVVFSLANFVAGFVLIGLAFFGDEV